MMRFNYYYLNEKSKSTFSLSMGSQIRLNFKICSIGANIDNKKNHKKQIRNSTVDFLVFTKDANENGIEVRFQDGTVWLTQNAIAELFDVDRSVINKHLKNIFKGGELEENSTCAKFAQVADNDEPHIALNNIKKRLQMMCGGSLSIAARESGGTVVTVFVPRPT